MMRFGTGNSSRGAGLAVFYSAWLILLKFVVPVGIVLVFLHAIGVI